ncbi:MAG TPA: MFS transporter [Candidatus Limnocylindrales bacterium]
MSGPAPGAAVARTMTGAPPPSDEPLRRNRDFQTLLVSQGVSALGDAVTATALPLLVLALTGSGLVMGTVTAINLGADFFMATIAGAMADRGDRKRMMLLADFGRALLTALIPLSDIVHGPTMAVIILTTGPLAILRGFFRAGYLSAMPNLVGRSQLPRGNGILETAYSTTFLVGPAIAGFLVTVIGPGPTLAVDAASFGISAIGLFLIRREMKAPKDRPPSRIRDDIREGIVYVWRHPILRTMILFFASTSAALASVSAALTFRIVRDLGLSPGAFGVTLSGFGIGTLLGSLIAARLDKRTNVALVMFGSVALMGLPLVGAAIVTTLPLQVLMSAISGFGESLLVVTYISVRAANSPDALVGRIASTARVFTLGFGPIGSLIGGTLIDTIGGTETLAVLGFAMVAIALLFVRAPGLWAASLANTPGPLPPAVSPVVEPLAEAELESG